MKSGFFYTITDKNWFQILVFFYIT